MVLEQKEIKVFEVLFEYLELLFLTSARLRPRAANSLRRWRLLVGNHFRRNRVPTFQLGKELLASIRVQHLSQVFHPIFGSLD